MSGAAVLCDVDGTLVDTNYLHVLAWSRALRDAGRWAPMNAIHRLIGMGADQLLPRLLGGHDDAIAEAHSRHYRAMWPEVAPFPGAAELVRRLAAEGTCVVLASSADRAELDVMIDLLGIGDVIAGAVSGEDASSSKPAPAIFDAAIERFGLDRSQTWVLGDSVWDVEAAKSAGVACVGLETGGFSAAELRVAGAVGVLRDVEETAERLPWHRLVATVR